MPNTSFLKNSSGTIWEDKGVHTFPKVILSNVNVIVRLEFELANYDSAVQHLNHYATKVNRRQIPQWKRCRKYVINMVEESDLKAEKQQEVHLFPKP